MNSAVTGVTAPMKFVTSLSLLLVATTALAAEPVSFEREVLPLLERRCNRCHHQEDHLYGLRSQESAPVVSRVVFAF